MHRAWRTSTLLLNQCCRLASKPPLGRRAPASGNLNLQPSCFHTQAHPRKHFGAVSPSCVGDNVGWSSLERRHTSVHVLPRSAFLGGIPRASDETNRAHGGIIIQGRAGSRTPESMLSTRLRDPIVPAKVGLRPGAVRAPHRRPLPMLRQVLPPARHRC